MRKTLLLYPDELKVGDKIKPWVRSPKWLKVKKLKKGLLDVPVHPGDSTNLSYIVWYSKTAFNVFDHLHEMPVKRKS